MVKPATKKSAPATKKSKVAAKKAKLPKTALAVNLDNAVAPEPPNFTDIYNEARDALRKVDDDNTDKMGNASTEEKVTLDGIHNALVAAIALLDANFRAFQDTLKAGSVLIAPTPEQLQKAQELANKLAEDITTKTIPTEILEIATDFLTTWRTIGLA